MKNTGGCISNCTIHDGFYSDVKKVILNEFRSFLKEKIYMIKSEKSKLYFLGKSITRK